MANKMKGIQNSIPPELQEKILAVHTITKGMYSDIDPAMVPDEGLVLAKNSVVRSDKISRRPGNSVFYPLAPDANRILRLLDFVRNNGDTNLVRHTKNSIYYCTSIVWVQCIGPALGGTDSDLVNSVVIDDRYFATNNGVNPIVEVDVVTNSYTFLGNSPNYKKVTGFFNRVIGANLGGPTPDPYEIGWSGDLDYTEWDPLVNISAGSVRLIDSSEDVSDFISDIFGFDAVLIVLRQKSIWMATKQPSASNPFNFFAKIPGIGCTCPNGTAKFPSGIIFPDIRTKSIYTFTIDGQIQDIGQPIRKALMSAMSNPELVFGSYNPTEAEYSLCIPNEITFITQEWKYNFRQQAWTYNEVPIVSAMTDVNTIVGTRTIADLEGTIADLLGTIADLSSSLTIVPRRLYGRFDGQIAIETDGQVFDSGFSETGYGFDYGFDYGGTATIDSTQAFSTVLQSKVYKNPGFNLYISALNLEVFCRNTGSFILAFSRDGGITFTDVKTFTITSALINKVFQLKYKKLTTCRRFAWRLTNTDIDFDLYSEEIKNYPAESMT